MVFDQTSHELGAIVHDQVRASLECLVQVAFEILLGRVVGGEDPHAPLGQGRADVVLGGEGIAPGDGDLRPGFRQEQGQIRRLRLQVDGHRDLAAAQ